MCTTAHDVRITRRIICITGPACAVYVLLYISDYIKSAVYKYTLYALSELRARARDEFSTSASNIYSPLSRKRERERSAIIHISIECKEIFYIYGYIYVRYISSARAVL